jgi:uncharacterized RDD family membrane protein YckC
MSTIKLENGQEINIGEDDHHDNIHVPVVDTQYYASPWSRILAFIFDLGFMYIFIQIFGYILSLFLILLQNQNIIDIFVDENISIILTVILIYIYFPGSFLLMKNTFGGRFMRINILNNNKEEPSNLKLFVRGLFFITFIIFNFTFITIFFDKRKRAVHDMIFGTVVTKDRIY